LGACCVLFCTFNYKDLNKLWTELVSTVILCLAERDCDLRWRRLMNKCAFGISLTYTWTCADGCIQTKYIHSTWSDTCVCIHWQSGYTLVHAYAMPARNFAIMCRYKGDAMGRAMLGACHNSLPAALRAYELLLTRRAPGVPDTELAQLRLKVSVSAHMDISNAHMHMYCVLTDL